MSVSLGSSKRDTQVEVEFLGERFQLQRLGCDGDQEKARALIAELDGKVDAIGLGGTDLYLVAGGRRYVIRDAKRLADSAKITPVVDGSGLKNTWEREVVRMLAARGLLHVAQEERGLRNLKALVTSGVDRWGMAEAMAGLQVRTIFGDLIFALGMPIALTRLWQIKVLARIALPYICRLPFERLYPTGAKQETTSPRYRRYYDWADIICGDFHFIRRYMPAAGTDERPLAGKTLLTNTITQEDVAELKRRGLARLITTTPELEGRSFGTNVMEGVVVSLLGKRPEELTSADYLGILKQLNWEPRVQDL